MKRIYNKELFNKIIDSFLGKFITLATSFIFSILAAKVSGASIYGEYSYFISIIMLFLVFSICGMDYGIIFYNPDGGKKNVSLAFFISFVFSIILSIIFYFRVENNIYLLLLLILLTSNHLFFGVYKIDENIREYYMIESFSGILRIILLYCIFKFSTINLIKLIYIYIFPLFLSIPYYFFRKKDKFTKFKLDYPFIKYSAIISLSSFVGVLMTNTDIIMLEKFSTLENVGIYKLLSQISILPSIILLIWDTVFAKIIVKLNDEKKIKELKKMYFDSIKILLIINLLILLIFIFYGKYFLFLIDKDYEIGYKTLIIKMIGQCIYSSGGSIAIFLNLTNQNKKQLFYNSVACIINLILNFFFIKKIGMEGAALATTVANIFFVYFGLRAILKYFKMKH